MDLALSLIYSVSLHTMSQDCTALSFLYLNLCNHFYLVRIHVQMLFSGIAQCVPGLKKKTTKKNKDSGMLVELKSNP